MKLFVTIGALAVGSTEAGSFFVTPTICIAQRLNSSPVIDGIQYHGAEVNMSNCLGFCLRRGYFTYGVDARDLCLCGDGIDAHAPKVNNEDCNDTCKGDESQPCGGLRRVRVGQVLPVSSIRGRNSRETVVEKNLDKELSLLMMKNHDATSIPKLRWELYRSKNL